MSAAHPEVAARPSRHVAPRPGTSGPDGERVVWRVRLLAVCVALAAVAFRQKPGLVVADTKLDLTTDPWGFLGRALHLWDPQGAFGQLQNQAYGYLFPMGPFHGVLHSLGVPPWVAQRLWWTLLLCTAFLGLWRLAGELRIGSPWMRLVGAVAYALSPRVASELTVTSVEVWPMAVAPWVLLPLVLRADRTWRWRVTRSALAFACCGGVNAVASGAALVLPTLWFLTRAPSRRTLTAFGGWLVAVVAAMAWWLVPLAVLGRHSPPFLDWIEGAAVTTSTASPFEAFRGTSAWLGFLSGDTGPQWPGGWLYVTYSSLIVATVVLAVLGLAGIALRRTPERTFLAVALVVGLALLTAGHTGSLGAPWSAGLQSLMDEGLAAFRNAHKFDLVVRLPLSLGLVSLLSAGLDQLRRVGARAWVAPLLLTSLVVTVTAPAIVANLGRAESYRQLPAHWSETARWLDEQPQDGAALVLPAASFADFTWGSPKDNPLQALMRRPLVLRDAVPLGSAGATRFLDGLGRELGAGRGGQGVRAALATAGVRYVVVPNDLRLDAAGDPLLAVHAGLEQSGLQRVATFGPPAGNPFEAPQATVDYRTLVPRPSIEVYEVTGTREGSAVPLDQLASGLAGPEDSAALASAGVPLALLGTDGAAARVRPGGPSVASDGVRRREVNFGEPANNTSHTLTPTEPTRQDRPVTDFVADDAAPMTTTSWSGVEGIRASSSASDADASLRLGPSAAPGAAVDGDLGTRWVSGTFGTAVGEWLQVDLAQRGRPRTARIDLSVNSPVGAAPTAVRVSTEAGAVDVDVPQEDPTVTVTLPRGDTRWVRVTATRTGPGTPNGFSIAELAVEDVTAQERLAVPPSTRPDVITLRRDLPGRSGCASTNGPTFCAPTLRQPADGPRFLARELRLERSGRYAMDGTVVARGRGADGLLDFGDRATATASSRLVNSPSDRPGAALDRDLDTGWVAGELDLRPRFVVELPRSRAVSGLQFQLSPQLGASRPREVRVKVDDAPAVDATLDDEGYVRFAPRSGRRVTIDLLSTTPLVSVDSRSSQRSFVPAGFSELRLLGADDLRKSVPAATPVGVPCGFGPTVFVNGEALTTEVTGTAGQLLRDRPLSWATCGGDDVRLRAASNVVIGNPSGEFVPETMTLRRQGTTTSPLPAALEVSRPRATELAVSLPTRDGATVVTVPQNYNPGWRARVGDATVAPIRVNGWMQGWVVPPEARGDLVATFGPDRAYRVGLGAGALVLLALVVTALVRRGRHVRPADTAPAQLAPRAALVVALALGAALAGWVGLLAVAVGTVLTATQRRSLVVVALAVVPGVVAAALVAADPWPAGRSSVEAWWVQALIVVPVLVTATWALGRLREQPVRAGSRHSAHAAGPVA